MHLIANRASAPKIEYIGQTFLLQAKNHEKTRENCEMTLNSLKKPEKSFHSFSRDTNYFHRD